MSFVSGTQIGKYELGAKLGEGGFGFVFKARDVHLDRELALKFLHPQHTANEEILRRFLQEARSAAKIVHPGIVTVFECGQVTGTGTANDGTAFIAMELLNGESLSDRLARAKRLSPSVAVEIARQVASALEAAHDAGIIHRDLKPDNIFLCKDPAMPTGERVKVLDFGIAKLAQTQGTGAQTRTHVMMGTPVYMSPEQCRSAAHIDPRSDIYTLGCILLELVVGKPPFDGEIGELIAKHQMVDAPRARSLAPDVPPALDDVIAAMLAKQPTDRPQTMGIVQRALAAADGRATPASGLPVLASHDQPTIHAQGQPRVTTLGGAAAQAVSVPPARRGRAGLIVGALAVAGVAVGGVVLATKGDAEDPRPAAAAATAPPTPTPAPAPPPEAAPAAPPAAPAPAKIRLELDATPKAEVWTFDGRLLGTTPYTSERVAAEGLLVFTLKAPGHQDQRVELPADQNVSRSVQLVKVEPVKSVRPKAKAPERRPNTPLKPGDIVID